MPNLGHTMETGNVSEWLKQPGDPVVRGDTVALVESDKVTVEIEAPADGVLLRVLTDAGQEVPPGSVLALVGDEADRKEADSFASGSNTGPEKRENRLNPPAQLKAKTELPSGSNSDSTNRPRRKATPLAKRLCAQLDLDPESIAGSGPKGVVVKEDVIRVSRSEPDVEISSQSPQTGKANRREGPLQGMRGSIAKRMARAWREIPMVTLVATADISCLLASDAYNEANCGINAAILGAIARTLEDHPQLNAWLIDNAIERCKTIDIGFAVALEDGLITPVIRRANQRSISNIAEEVKRLATDARKGRLAPADLVDAGFTVSNLGAFGVEIFTPIVNPPQVAIIGVGVVHPVPAMTDTGIEFRQSVSLSLVFDHRALDGAIAARCLQDLKSLLADPQRLFAGNGETSERSL